MTPCFSEAVNTYENCHYITYILDYDVQFAATSPVREYVPRPIEDLKRRISSTAGCSYTLMRKKASDDFKCMKIFKDGYKVMVW